MNHLFVCFIWCGAQVAAISFLALMTSRYLIRDAKHSSRLLNVTAVLVLAVTLATFVRLDHERLRAFALGQPQTERTVAVPSTTPWQSFDRVSHSAKDGSLTVSARQLQTWLASVRSKSTRVTTTVGNHAPSRWCVIVGLIFSCIAIIRLASSFVYLRRLARSSIPVCDRSIQAEVEMLCRRIEFNGTVIIAESDSLDNAAVFGGKKRPRIVLPLSWRNWNRAERLAVIAHEISHVIRNDTVWRVIQVIAYSLHAYNPLMYLLQRRGVFMQEVAADQRAWRTLKLNNTNYLQGLLQLAIRQDETLPTGNRFGNRILVQSGFLLRRIEMLRTKDGIHQTNAARRATDRVVVFGLTSFLAFFAVATCGLRGTAQEASPPEIRVATRSIQSQSAPSVELFQRPVYDPALLGETDDGMFIIRFDELSRMEGMKPLLTLAGAKVKILWKHERPDWPIPEIDFNDLEYVAGHASMQIDAPNPNDERPNRVMFGADVVVIRFKSPIDLESSIKKFAPDAEVVRRGDTNVYKIHIPAIGPQPFFLQLRDAQTVWLVKASAGQPNPLPDEKNKDWHRPWRSAWEREDGGIATFVASNAKFGKTLVRSEEAQIFEDILRNVETFSVCMDSNHSNDAVFRVVFGCQSEEKARRLRERYETGRKTLKTKQVEQNERQFLERYYEVSSRVELRNDGGADVTIEFPVEDVAAGLLKSMSE